MEENIISKEEMIECVKENLGGACYKHNCETCPDLEECYSSIVNEDEYLDSIDYGGYESSEEFWDQLYN